MYKKRFLKDEPCRVTLPCRVMCRKPSFLTMVPLTSRHGCLKIACGKRTTDEKWDCRARRSLSFHHPSLDTPKKSRSTRRNMGWDIRKHGIRKDTCAPTTIAPQKRSITNYRSHGINGVSCCCRRLPLRRRVWSLSRISSIEWNRRSRTICELGSTFTLSTSIPARPPPPPKTRIDRTVATFAWEGDDLILDNTEVFKSGIMWKYFGWVVELALHMGWLTVTPGLLSADPGYYKRGPNLLMVPFDKNEPMTDYAKESFRDGSIFQEYPNDFSEGPVAVVTEGQGWTRFYQGAHFMVMAKAFNWHFVRLNEAFAKLKQTPLAVQTIERPLFVYVNLVESQWLEE